MMMSGYDFLKGQVLRRWQKVGSDWDVFISSGRVFQTRGPATVKARSPTVERLVGVTSRRLAHFRVELYTSIQRPCIRSALGRAASEGKQQRRWYGSRISCGRSAVLSHSVPTVDDVLGRPEGQPVRRFRSPAWIGEHQRLERGWRHRAADVIFVCYYDFYRQPRIKHDNPWRRFEATECFILVRYGSSFLNGRVWNSWSFWKWKQ